MSLTPFLRRRLVEPCWARYSGSPVLSASRRLEASQWWPESRLLERQWDELKALVSFARDHNAFYRARLDRCGLGSGPMSGMEDFRRIPILTKKEVQAQGAQLLSQGFDASSLLKAKTGGSTGKALELSFTEEVSQLRNASGRRHRRWAGWEVGEPVGAVWGNPVYPQTAREKLREWLLAPVIYLDTMSITPEAVERFGRDWARTRPTLMFGHAHSLFVLAQMVREHGIGGITPRAIVASSMMLLPHERALIESVFSVRVCDMYGCEEVGLIASECERHEGLHVNLDQLVVEVVRDDGRPAAPGEPGLVVVTDLLNRAMPFIRYRMEDVAELAERPCSCGRGLPMLKRVTGRVADFLRRRDGSRVAGISLIENSLTKIPGIDQLQIIQETVDCLRLRVVPGEAFDSGRHRELVEYFERTFPGASVELERVAGIDPEPNGKYRFSICLVPD